MDSNAWLSAIVAGLTAIFGWLKARDAVKFSTVDKEIERLTKQNTDQEARLVVVQKEATTCHAESEILRHKIEFLEKMSASLAAPAFITASMPECTIQDASDEVYSILGWRPAELIGRSIDLVIPEDFRDLHHEGIIRAVERKTIRPGTISVMAFGLHKMGSRIPIIVNLTEKSKSPWVVVAQLNHRKT